jgi:hypothetical protein
MPVELDKHTLTPGPYSGMGVGMPLQQPRLLLGLRLAVQMAEKK